jgi:hypothetical protein
MEQQVIFLDKKSLNSFQIKIKKQLLHSHFMSIDLLEKAGEMYVADHKNVSVPNMLTTTSVFCMYSLYFVWRINVGNNQA